MKPLLLLPTLILFSLAQLLSTPYSATSITVYHTVIYTTTLTPIANQGPNNPTYIPALTTAIVTILQPRALEAYSEYPRDGALLTGTIISHLTASPSYTRHTTHSVFWTLISNAPIGVASYIPPAPPSPSLDRWITASTSLTKSYIGTTVTENNVCLMALGAPEAHITVTTKEYVTLVEPVAWATNYPDTIRKGITRYSMAVHAYANGETPSIIETSEFMTYTVTRTTTMVRVASPTTTMITVTARARAKGVEEGKGKDEAEKRWEPGTTWTAFPKGWGPEGGGCAGILGNIAAGTSITTSVSILALQSGAYPGEVADYCARIFYITFGTSFTLFFALELFKRGTSLQRLFLAASVLASTMYLLGTLSQTSAEGIKTWGPIVLIACLCVVASTPGFNFRSLVEMFTGTTGLPEPVQQRRRWRGYRPRRPVLRQSL